MEYASRFWARGKKRLQIAPTKTRNVLQCVALPRTLGIVSLQKLGLAHSCHFEPLLLTWGSCAKSRVGKPRFRIAFEMTCKS